MRAPHTRDRNGYEQIGTDTNRYEWIRTDTNRCERIEGPRSAGIHGGKGLTATDRNGYERIGDLSRRDRAVSQCFLFLHVRQSFGTGLARD